MGDYTLSRNPGNTEGQVKSINDASPEILRKVYDELSSQIVVDGDNVTLRGYCAQSGRRRIGFGDCTGVVLSA